MPFISGTRRCLGQSFATSMLQAFIVELVQHFRWELVNKHEKWTIFPVPRPRDGLLVADFNMRL